MADKGVINVTMREDTERLDEVVVTALGINVQKKRCHTMFSQVKIRRACKSKRR